MPRPRKVVPEQVQPTPTQTVQQMEKAFHPNQAEKVTVDEFVHKWNSMFHLFSGGISLDENRKPLVKAVLKQLNLLKE